MLNRLIHHDKDTQQAFKEAIDSGRLSEVKTSDNYAGAYMFMGTEGKRDLFKHIDTRKYL